MPAAPVNVHDLLKGHVPFQLESIDRLYLNGYVPHLQHGAGLVGFLSQHRGYPIASPALLGQITGQFVAQVKAFAQREGIPLFPFERHESKDQCAHHWRAQRPVRDAVVFIGVAQEKANAFSARRLPGKRALFEFTRGKSVLPNYYYFYLDDADWGEAFIKVCSYAPWGLKVYSNGHEWLKRQLAKEGIGFQALDNGFLSCQNPEHLQALADTLGPEHIQRFLKKWLVASHRCYLTPYGWKLARLYARLDARVFRPALTAMNGPPEVLSGRLKRALQAVDAELDRLLAESFPARKTA